MTRNVRLRQVLAWIAWALALLLNASAWAIAVWGTGLAPTSEVLAIGVLVASFLAFPTVGLVVVTRRPLHRIGWLLCAVGPIAGVQLLAGSYSDWAIARQALDQPAAVGLLWLGTWFWVPSLLLPLIGLLLLFPDGLLPSRRWRRIAWLVIAGPVIEALVLAVQPGALDERVPTLENPFAVSSSLESTLEILRIVGGAWVVASLLAAASALLLRYLGSSGDARQQLRWFLCAVSVVVVWMLATAPFSPVWMLLGGEPAISLALAALPILPVAIGVAILRYRLYDIDLLINRTLVYGALTAIVLVTYVLIVSYLGVLFQTTITPAISLVATAVIAVMFQPLRAYLQRGVNRLLYGDRDEPYAVLARLGSRLEEALRPETVLPTIVRTVAEALRLPYAAVTVGGQPGVVVSTGKADPDPVRVPLIYQREVVGELLLGPRAPGETFGPADRRLLADLGRHIGMAVHAVRLTSDLQQSREHLVTTREEERRRLRRDLHDGLGPALASMMLKAESARDLLETDLPAADELLRDLISQLEEATTDIRRLVYALRPPALDELGLVGALRATAARHGASEPRIVVDAPDQLGPLPAAIEVAAYRIAQEAVTNVARHSSAHSCCLRLEPAVDPTGLRLDVVDDGLGVPEDRPSGVGLTSMRERAEELGGSCAIERLAAGGTRVRVWLPYTRAERTDH